MQGRFTVEDLKYWFFKDRIPVIKALVVTNILTFLAVIIFHIEAVGLLGFTSSGTLLMPWTLFTYPLLWTGDVIGLLFAGYWLWVAGGSLERTWGSGKFALYFFGMSAVSALGLFLGYLVSGVSASAGIWISLAGVTVAFAMLNPEQTILFFFVIPMKLKYLAMLSAATTFIMFGKQNLLLGILSLAGCAVSYWYVRSMGSFGLRRTRRDDDPGVIRIRPKHSVRRSLNPLKWYHDRREEQRLKDLFKRSGLDD